MRSPGTQLLDEAHRSEQEMGNDTNKGREIEDECWPESGVIINDDSEQQ